MLSFPEIRTYGLELFIDYGVSHTVAKCSGLKSLRLSFKA